MTSIVTHGYNKKFDREGSNWKDVVLNFARGCGGNRNFFLKRRKFVKIPMGGGGVVQPGRISLKYLRRGSRNRPQDFDP